MLRPQAALPRANTRLIVRKVRPRRRPLRVRQVGVSGRALLVNRLPLPPIRKKNRVTPVKGVRCSFIELTLD